MKLGKLENNFGNRFHMKGSLKKILNKGDENEIR